MKKPKQNSLDYSLYLLKIRDRSVGEIREKLTTKGYESEEITNTIGKLIEKKFLDDEKFVDNLIQRRLQISHFGKQRIWQDLKKRFVENNQIDEALNSIDESDEEEAATHAKESYIRKRGTPKDFNEKQKLIAYLGRRGFGWGIIEKVM